MLGCGNTAANITVLICGFFYWFPLMKLQSGIKPCWGTNSFSTELATTSSDELPVKEQTQIYSKQAKT